MEWQDLDSEQSKECNIFTSLIILYICFLYVLFLVLIKRTNSWLSTFANSKNLQVYKFTYLPVTNASQKVEYTNFIKTSFPKLKKKSEGKIDD